MTADGKGPDRRFVLGLAAAGCAGLALGADIVLARRPEASMVRRSGLAFGTTVSVTLVDDGAAAIEPAFEAAFAAIRAIERAANLFDPGSEIARLNRDGRLDHPSADFLAMVRFALHLAEATDGAFDPTVQPIWCAWRDAHLQGRMPDAATLAAAVTRVGYRAVRVAEAAVAFAGNGMGLTLNALAQGLATDRVMAAVAACGIRNAFIDTGELGARGGRPNRGPWRVGIADPRAVGRLLTEFSLADRRFVATSADNQTFWTPDFAEHHIVEPWSGHSPRALAECAIVASSGLMADGLSTAAMVVGPARVGDLLALDPGAIAYLVDKAGRTAALGPGIGAV
ncbi:FAD:protein FMN transferase [Oleomonas cavernae]|uniref:FAD:protein FMN transferase n=1 Tax=Oleomonas cavernae TaxID=2320859 RepID=A0A418WES9_9PROT|nr:FAD:protein FMN transferase [Oleomonas cavernae]RJF88496.1 FAD:protein FMN transferase [Oleomonas cavernae]